MYADSGIDFVRVPSIQNTLPSDDFFLQPCIVVILSAVGKSELPQFENILLLPHRRCLVVDMMHSNEKK